MCEDALDGEGVEAAVLLRAQGGGEEGFLAVLVGRADQGSEVDWRERLETQLQALDECGEGRKPLGQGLGRAA